MILLMHILRGMLDEVHFPRSRSFDEVVSIICGAETKII